MGGLLTLNKTDGRLTRFKNGAWHHFSNEFIDPDWRFFNLIYCDSHNSVWLTVTGGDLEQAGQILKLNNHGHWSMYEGRLGSRSALCFSEDTSGVIFAYMVNDVLMKFQDDEFIAVHGSPLKTEEEEFKKLKGIESNSDIDIQAFYEWQKSKTKIENAFVIDHQNTLWAHTATGISKFKIVSDTLEFLNFIDLNLIKRQDPIDVNMQLSQDGHIWFGCDEGAFEIIGDSVTHHYPLPNSKWNKVRDIEFDSEHSPWLITNQEMYYYKDSLWKQVQFPIPEDKTGFLRSLLIDKDDNKWVGTSDSGILIYNEHGVEGI